MEKGRLRHRETRVNIHGCLFDGKPMDNTRSQERQTVIFRADNWLLSFWAIELVEMLPLQTYLTYNIIDNIFWIFFYEINY